MADRTPDESWPGKKALRDLKVLEILVGTAYNSTNQEFVVEGKYCFNDFTDISISSILWMLRRLLAYKNLSILSTGLIEERILHKSRRVCIPEGRIHELHMCVSHFRSLTKQWPSVLVDYITDGCTHVFMHACMHG